MLLKFSHINPSFIDTCEGAFFSVYIDHKMNVSPCSFSAGKDSYSLKDFAFYDIWKHISLTPIEQSGNLTALWIVCIKVYVMGTVPITHK